MTKTHTIIAAIIITLTAALIIIARRRTKNTTTTTTLPTATTTRTDAYPLHQGSRGPRVATLQKGLNTTYATTLTIDGILGPLTLEAIKKHLNKTSLTETDLRSLYYPSDYNPTF